jgi:hypothetical protein
MFKVYTFFIAILFLSFTLSGCEKLDNELDNIPLANPYDPNSGVELMQIDSMQRYYGSTNYLKGYFHINSLHVPDTSIVQRVILYRDGVEKGRLSPGNISFFADITAQPGGTYDYQLQFLMKDSSYTKLTTSYVIVF